MIGADRSGVDASAGGSRLCFLSTVWASPALVCMGTAWRLVAECWSQLRPQSQGCPDLSIKTQKMQYDHPFKGHSSSGPKHKSRMNALAATGIQRKALLFFLVERQVLAKNRANSA